MGYVRLIFICLLFSTTLFAEVEDKFKINIGGMYVTTSATQISFSPKGTGSIMIDTADQLGHEYKTNVFYMNGYYRFNDKHSISMGYVGVDNKGFNNITKELEWDNVVISAGAEVDSYLNIDIFRLDYGYSFYHNEDVELMLTAGIHLTNFDIGLSAKGDVDSGSGPVYTETYKSSESLLAPLPTIGFKGEYTIIQKKLFVTYNVDYFYLEYDNYDGSLINSSLGLEYRFVDNFGVGIGYDNTIMEVGADIGDTSRIEAENQISGITMFFTYIY
jgi:hypothetical protein